MDEENARARCRLLTDLHHPWSVGSANLKAKLEIEVSRAWGSKKPDRGIGMDMEPNVVHQRRNETLAKSLPLKGWVDHDILQVEKGCVIPHHAPTADKLAMMENADRVERVG